MNRFLRALASVAIALMACNPACAGDATFMDGFHLGGYTSVNFNKHPGGVAEVALDEVSLFVSWDGDERWRMFSEIELEEPLRWQEGESISDDDAYFDIERLYLDYVYSERATVRMGRFLTPIGRWNLIHAAPLVWTTQRPLVTNQLFPLNINGVMLQGAQPLGDAVLEYAVYGEVVQDMRENEHEIPYDEPFGARLALSGKIEAGLSLLDFREETPGRPHYRMLGLDFSAARNGWEASAELYQRERVGGDHAGSGGYLQGIAPLSGGWFAVARAEWLQRPGAGSIERWLIGATWRLDERRVFKLDYTGGDEERPDAPKGMFASFAVLF